MSYPYNLPTNEIVRLYRAGWSLPQLARKYSVSSTPIRQRLLAQGVELRPFKCYKGAGADILAAADEMLARRPEPCCAPPTPPTPSAPSLCLRCDTHLTSDGIYTWCPACAWEWIP